MRRVISLALAAILSFAFVTPRAFAQETEAPFLTRAGALALLMESDPDAREMVEWYRRHMPPVALFSDVQQHLWYAPYVETAFERGVLFGNRDGTFRPGHLLTAHDAALLFSRLWQHTGTTLFASWSRSGEYYTPTLADMARANGMTMKIEHTPIARRDFLALLQAFYPHSAMARLPREAQAWRGRTGAHAPQTHTPASTIAQLPISPQSPSVRSTTPVPRFSALTATSTPAATDAFTISMPTLGINDLTVHHPSNPFTSQGLLDVLKSGVGHLFSYPGRGGKILIYGHSSSYPWDVSAYTKIFRRINELQVGDTVDVTFEGQRYTYAVREKKAVPARDMSEYQNEGNGEELILYTCWPPDSITQRYLVIASPAAAVAAR